MVVRDLTEEFITRVIGAGDAKSYEGLNPELFCHYFNHWCPRSYHYSNLSESELRARSSRVRRTLDDLIPLFESKRYDCRNLSAVLFVGGNTSNGHALLNGTHSVIWLPVETYANEMRARVFVAHEIVHALHYTLSPDFYFQDEEARLNLGRQLITEGLATFLSAEILGISDREALWADYLNASLWEQWISTCQGRAVAIRSLCRVYFSTTWGRELFQANDPENIMRYRAGYFVGLCLVREVAEEKQLSCRELLSLERGEFEKLVLERLVRA